MDQQLRRREKSKVFRALLLLHSAHLYPRFILMCQSIRFVHQARVEGVLDFFTSSDGRLAAVPHFWGAALRRLHHHHAGNAIKRNLEWRNGNWAIEEGGGALGEEVALEKHRSGVWSLLSPVDVAVQPAQHQVQDGKLPVSRLSQNKNDSKSLQPARLVLCFLAYREVIFVRFLTSRWTIALMTVIAGYL